MNNFIKTVQKLLFKNYREPMISHEKRALIGEIRNVSQELENAYNRFEFESDADLIEASIYEIESLKAKYRHLLYAVKALDDDIDADGNYDDNEKIAE